MQKQVQRPLKVNQIVPIGFGIVLILTGIVTTISEISKAKLKQIHKIEEYTYEVKLLLKQLEKDIVDAETGQRGFLLTGKENYLQRFATLQSNFQARSQDLKKLMNDSSFQSEKTDQIIQLAQTKFSELEQTIALKKAGKDQEILAVLASNKGEQIMNDIKATLAEMEQQEQSLLQQTEAASNQFQQLSTIINWGGWLVSVGAGIYISFYVIRRIMLPINEAAYAVATSSGDIATSVFEQERIILQQSASVNQTTTTVDDIGTSALQSAAQAETSASGAKQALTLAEEGTTIVSLAIAGISQLRDQVMAIANQTTHLSEQTTQISTISDLVAELANQTNMLALNAEVEAARAGEQGKGFAVVANEIRKLADQSRKSADQISVLVHQVQVAINSAVMVTDEGTKKASEGIKLAQETGDAFASIADAVNQVFLNNQQIVLNARQQAIAVQQIVSAMNAINLGAKETATGISLVKNATINLNETVQKLKNLV